ARALIVQPIFNVLLAIYGIIPGNDFGVALIIFTILVRFAMWPLLKKQLHQTRLMRQIQPELKKVKARAKGNKMLESQMMMELYRERGVRPFSSIGLLLIQLPIFIALFRVIQILTSQRHDISRYTYDFMQNLGAIRELVAHPDKFNEMLFGVINLTQHAVTSQGVYVPLLLLAILAAVLQYIQSKQVLPQQDSKKKLRDILKDSSKGKAVDQSEVTAIMSGRMIMLLPAVLFFIGLYLPGALVLYYAVSSLVAIAQQRVVLSKDLEEMETIADKDNKRTPKKASKPGKPASANGRAENAQEATVVEAPKKKKSGAKRKRR
ncbi:60 kDa inner membrane insertion protein, partial [candidate division TM7 genomosp. GTL1]